MTLVRRRGSINIYDYPEHLNPFREEHEVSIGNKHRTFGSRSDRAGSFRNAWNFITTTKSKIGRSHSLSRDSSPVSTTHETWTLVSPRLRQSRTVSQQNSPPPRPPPPQKTPPVTPRNNDHVTASTPSPDSSDQRFGSLRPKKRRAPPPPSLSSRQPSRTSLSSVDTINTTESSGNVHSPSVKSQDSDISEILTMAELANKIHDEFHTDSSDEREKTSTSNEDTKEVKTEIKDTELTEMHDSNRVVTEIQVSHNENGTHDDETNVQLRKKVQNVEIHDLSVNKNDSYENIGITYIDNEEKERDTENTALPVLKIVESDEEAAKNSDQSVIKIEVKTISKNVVNNEDEKVTVTINPSAIPKVSKEAITIERDKSNETCLDYESAENMENHGGSVNECKLNRDENPVLHTNDTKETHNESLATINNLQGNGEKVPECENSHGTNPETDEPPTTAKRPVKSNLNGTDTEAEEPPDTTKRPIRSLSVSEYVKKYEMASNNTATKDIPVTRVTVSTRDINPVRGRTASEIKQNGTLNRNTPEKNIIKTPANGTLNKNSEMQEYNDRTVPIPATRSIPKPSPRKKKISISKFFSK